MRNTKKTILVPIDFSLESINGLRTAVDIAKNLWCEILLLHIMNESNVSTTGEAVHENRSKTKSVEIEEKLIHQRTEHLRGLRIQYHIPKVRISMHILVNPGLTELENIFAHHKIDLIAVGAKGEYSAEDNLHMDKNLMKQMHISGVPLLAVHHYKPHLKYSKLLMHVDFKNYDEKSVRLIDKFTELLNMQILVTHNNDVDVDILKKNLNKFSDTYHLNDYTFLSSGIVDEEDLNSFAADQEVDLFMTTRKIQGDKIRLHVNNKKGPEITWADNSVLSMI